MATQDEKKIIITFGRQYGSGGRRIGKMVAEELGIPFYDKGLLALAASESCLNSQLLDLVDEQAMHIYMQASLAASAAARGDDAEIRWSLNDQLYHTEAQIIRETARQSSCVIVGRTAHFILRDDPAMVSFFVHAPMDARIQAVMEMDHVSAAEAKQIIESADAARAQYYKYHTGTPWANLTDFDLSIDSTVLGITETANELVRFARLFMDRSTQS